MTVILTEAKPEGEDVKIVELVRLNIDPTSEFGTYLKTNSTWPEYLFVREHGAFALEDWNGSEEATYFRTSGFVL